MYILIFRDYNLFYDLFLKMNLYLLEQAIVARKKMFYLTFLKDDYLNTEITYFGDQYLLLSTK